MCGIAGTFWHEKQASQLILEKALLALEHRGPDEAGLYIDDRVGLVHSRLSIIDLATGTQPFSCTGTQSFFFPAHFGGPADGPTMPHICTLARLIIKYPSLSAFGKKNT